MEDSIAVLQVKDVPNKVYERIQESAKMRNHSIDQEAVILLENGLSTTEKRNKKNEEILKKIAELGLRGTDTFPSPEELVREDRDR
jgi:hypothetical protein